MWLDHQDGFGGVAGAFSGRCLVIETFDVNICREHLVKHLSQTFGQTFDVRIRETFGGTRVPRDPPPGGGRYQIVSSFVFWYSCNGSCEESPSSLLTARESSVPCSREHMAVATFQEAMDSLYAWHE